MCKVDNSVGIYGTTLSFQENTVPTKEEIILSCNGFKLKAILIVTNFTLN